MDEPVQQDDDDCPELVPIENDKQIPVTIITGYLGTRRQYYCCLRCICYLCLTGVYTSSPKHVVIYNKSESCMCSPMLFIPWLLIFSTIQLFDLSRCWEDHTLKFHIVGTAQQADCCYTKRIWRG
jgi:hypothetical protein